MHEKPTLRRSARDRRKAFVRSRPNRQFLPSATEALSGLIRPGFAVATYSPIGDEANPAFLDAIAHERGATLLWPRIVGEGQMNFSALGASLGWEAAPYGGQQPGADSQPYAPDIVFLPLLGFDRSGTRLGQGGGHYDRTLPLYPQAYRIGIAWAVQEMDSLPRDPWDIALHAVITEKEWITCE